MSIPASSSLPVANLEQQPIYIERVEKEQPIRVELAEEPAKRKLGLFARYPDGRSVLIKEVAGTDVEKAWNEFKNRPELQGVRELRLDLTASKAQFQGRLQNWLNISLYEKDLTSFHQAIGTIKELNHLELPTHAPGHRTSSAARAGLQKDDPRLKTLAFDQTHVEKALNQHPLNDAGLAQKMAILKRKMASELLLEEYAAITKRIIEKRPESLLEQSEQRKLAEAVKTPLDRAAILFNAVHPFPSFTNLEEFKEALYSQLRIAKKWIRSHPIPKAEKFLDRFSAGISSYSSLQRIDIEKERFYAKEIALAGLPEQNLREMYELALRHFEAAPTRDSGELLFIRLAEKVSQGDYVGVDQVLDGPSSNLLFGALRPEGKDAIKAELRAYAHQIIDLFNAPSLQGDPLGAVPTRATFTDAAKTLPATWNDLAANRNGPTPVSTPDKLIEGFNTEVAYLLNH